MIHPDWINDRSEYQQNYVHGLRNAHGLQLQFELEGEVVVTTWSPSEHQVGFPGFVHGGLVSAVLDDTMGRVAALYRRFMVTARLEVRFRSGAELGVPLRVEGWRTRLLRRALHAEGRITAPDDRVVAEATGTYLPLSRDLEQRMVAAWPGFAEWLEASAG